MAIQTNSSGTGACTETDSNFDSASPNFVNAISCVVRQQNRQFGRRREQQLQMVDDSNREIREYLSRAGIACAAMHRGIGKRLVCIRNAKGGRDE